MKRFRSLPLIAFKIPWHFGRGWGRRSRITIEQVSSKVLPALPFMDICLNFVNQIDSRRTADVFPTKLNAIMQS